MQSSHTRSFSPGELALLLICLVFWGAFVLLVPQASSIDVYLFRDAAMSWVQGHGFATASYEKSTSFAPVLYSSYTPLAQWLLIPFLALLGTGWRSGSLETFLLGASATALVLRIALPLARGAMQRWLLVGLAGVGLPAGFIAAQVDRAEATSFLLLLALLFLLSRTRQGVASFVLQGLVAGCCFLSEPFAGVLAVLLITGSALARTLALPAGERQRFPFALSLRSFLLQGLVSGVCFALPIAATVGAFEHSDPTALARFQAQAKFAGTQRPVHYSMSADSDAPGAKPAHDSFTTKLKAGLGSDGHSLDAALHLMSYLVLCGGGLLLAFRSTEGRGSFVALAVLLLTILLPLLAFPLQPNYRVLVAGLVPSALALGWAGLAMKTPGQRLLWGLMTLQFALVLPPTALHTISRIDTRASFLLAVQQARETGSYLDRHGLAGSVLLVPPSDYTVYKPFHTNVYNPNYYAHVEGTAAIGGFLECRNGSRDFTNDPLPPHLPGSWKLLSPAGGPAVVSLFGHRLMSRNWGLGCDVYVRPAPGA